MNRHAIVSRAVNVTVGGSPSTTQIDVTTQMYESADQLKLQIHAMNLMQQTLMSPFFFGGGGGQQISPD
jgi:hypothetical protein